MKAVCLTTIVIVLLKFNSSAQGYYQVGAKSKSLAGISACLNDEWSIFGNQAGLCNVSSIAGGVSYSSYFLIKDLSLKSAFLLYPIQENAFGLSFYRFGNEYYNENKLGFAYSKELSRSLHVGLQFNYFSISFYENDKSPGVTSLELGVQYIISNNLLIGTHIFNPFQSCIETATVKYKYPSIYRIGLRHKLANNMSAFYEFEKDLQNSVIAKFALEYTIRTCCQLRAGYAVKPSVFSLGLGFKVGQLNSAITYQYNQILGSTPSISISYLK